MIVGRDIMIPMGIIINFNNYTIQWINHSIPMKESYQVHNQEGLPGDTSMEYEDSELFTDEIIDRKYQSVTPKHVIDEQHHLKHPDLEPHEKLPKTERISTITQDNPPNG